MLAAAHLRVGGRRLRAIARGDDEGLRAWLADESAWRLATVRTAARASLATLDALGARVIALGDDDYPQRLLDLRDPPAFLTVRGTLFAGGIAIVGSRTPQPACAAFARALSMRLTEPVVSGLALGVDAAAHEGALAGGNATLAYVGTGLASTYPHEHVDLAERIVSAGGAVVSEYLPEQTVSRWSLVRRDRLQAAHARACVLISSEPDGGAMHTMKVAAELGRPRFVLDPAVIGTQLGNRVARDDGATIIPLDVDAALSLLPTLAGDSDS